MNEKKFDAKMRQAPLEAAELCCAGLSDDPFPVSAKFAREMRRLKRDSLKWYCRRTPGRLICAVLLIAVLVCTITAPVTVQATASYLFDSFTPVGQESGADAAFLLYRQLQRELTTFSGFRSALCVFSAESRTYRTPPEGDLHTAAQAAFDGADSPADGIVLYYSAFTNEAAMVCGEDAAAVLTEEDRAAVEAAFTAPETDNVYRHVNNGLKHLLVCVFDSGAFDVPPYSYTAEYLRDPDSEPDSAPLPRTGVYVFERIDEALPAAVSNLAEVPAEQLASLRYLGNEIGRYAGLTVNLLVTGAGSESAFAESAASYLRIPNGSDPATAVLLGWALDTDETCLLAGENAAALFPDDVQTRICDAMAHAEGGSYEHVLAGLEELARVLFEDGPREYSPYSGIALALDPDAFGENAVPVTPEASTPETGTETESLTITQPDGADADAPAASDGISPAVWIAVAAGIVVLAIVVLVLSWHRRKNRAG